MPNVGTFFQTIVDDFAHVADHVVKAMTPTLGSQFGLGPPQVRQLVELMMHAHAGNAAARHQVEQLALTQPGMKQAMTQVSLKLREHPHFTDFQGHAVTQQAAVVGGAFVGRHHRHHGHHKHKHHKHRPPPPSAAGGGGGGDGGDGAEADAAPPPPPPPPPEPVDDGDGYGGSDWGGDGGGNTNDAIHGMTFRPRPPIGRSRLGTI